MLSRLKFDIVTIAPFQISALKKVIFVDLRQQKGMRGGGIRSFPWGKKIM